MEVKDYDITVGSGIISIFQRQSFRLDRVFSEFIDNSLQSFLDHQEVLERLADGKKCKVSIIWDENRIVIKDNAYGMNDEEFARALKLRATNPNALRNNQLSVYGMGLKYASVYLGDHYSISSTAFNSPTRYYAEVDVPTLEAENPETIPAHLSSEMLEAHETTITITKLRIKRTTAKERDLCANLGVIYNHYIHSGILSISVNGIPVNYQRPELRPNEEGGYYYESFEDSFTVGGKTYEFSGWIGILNKGNQSITGLNLIQANRCIELGYKPEGLFGKGNSFQNSRVIGEVVFKGNNYVLSFNKDKFVWADDGAEEAFISKMCSNSQIAYIIKMSKELTYKDDDDKLIKKTTKSFKDNPVISIVKDVPQVTKARTETIQNPDERVPTNQDNGRVIDNHVEPKDYLKFQVEVDGQKVPLYVDTKQGSKEDDWLVFEKYEDGYIVHINTKNKFICRQCNTQASKAASNTIAIVLATSMLQAQNLGLKLSEAKLLLTTMNQIMGKNNE